MKESLLPSRMCMCERVMHLYCLYFGDAECILWIRTTCTRCLNCWFFFAESQFAIPLPYSMGIYIYKKNGLLLSERYRNSSQFTNNMMVVFVNICRPNKHTIYIYIWKHILFKGTCIVKQVICLQLVWQLPETVEYVNKPRTTVQYSPEN